MAPDHHRKVPHGGCHVGSVHPRRLCNFGAVATANTILENTQIGIPTVFGSGSPEATEVAGDGGAAGTQSFADFVGSVQLGLEDDYASDGRVLVEATRRGGGEDAGGQGEGNSQGSSLLLLMQAYKQLDAPFGELSRASETISTVALESNSPGDATYTQLEADLADITTKRDALVSQIQPLLQNAEFGNGHVDQNKAQQLTDQANALIAGVVRLVERPQRPAVN